MSRDDRRFWKGSSGATTRKPENATDAQNDLAGPADAHPASAAVRRDQNIHAAESADPAGSCSLTPSVPHASNGPMAARTLVLDGSELPWARRCARPAF